MTAARLAQGLFAFQLPTAILLVLGGAGSVALRADRDWLPYAAVPLSIALLLGSLVTWAVESWLPLPGPSRGRRIVRYLLPTLLLVQLPMGFSAWLAGALFRRSFDAGTAALVYAALLGGFALIAGAPLVFLALRGVLTPPPVGER
jgi:hypothetical protein